MNTLQQMRTWSATHHPRWLIIPRIGLGLLLFAKGIYFMRDSTILEQIIYGNSSVAENTTHWLPILIVWANLLCGFFLMIGLMTRLMALLQIPILLGAIFFISGYGSSSDVWLALLALLLSILFFIEGSGPLSLDAYFSRNREKGSQGRNLP